MKSKAIYTGILLSVVFVLNSTAQKSDFPVLKGPYLGQKPPGMIPEIFAPGIISTRYHEHSAVNFSPNGKEVVYTLSCEHGHVILFSGIENGIWSIPKPAPFSGIYSDDKHIWSSDSNTLFFSSKRPLVGSSESKNVYKDWFVTRNISGWNSPEIHNSQNGLITKSGNKYIIRENPQSDGDWNIFVSKFENGIYNEPEKLGDEVNTDKMESSIYVDPEEKLMIFSTNGRPDQIGLMDLYISFRIQDNNWTKAINLGEPINAPGLISRFPLISYDGKYLFYWHNKINISEENKALSYVEESLQMLMPWRPDNNKDGDIYWVDAKFIEKLKPIKLK